VHSHRLVPHRSRAGLAAALAAFVVLGATVVYGHVALAAAPEGGWLSFRHGHLVYGHDDQGNRIPDFSYAGYRNSEAPIPHVPARARVSPPADGGDATALIQGAIDSVSALPIDRHGFRGAVVLERGTYPIGTSLHIQASGVVLRGSGAGEEGEDGTLLLPANPVARTLVNIGGTGKVTPAGPAHSVVDDYVPVGSRTVTLDTTDGLAVGDDVIVQRPQTQAWIHAIGMDAIPPRPDGKPITQWPPNSGLQFQRKIAAINGSQVTLDVPLTNALEKVFTNATVWKYTFAGRISQVGLEDLSSDGIAMRGDPTVTTGSGFFNVTFVNLDAVDNAWVRNTTVTRYSQPYLVGTGAIRVSILHTRSLHMEQMMRQDILDQPFTYGVSGQQVLVRDAVVTGSNVHAWTTQSRTPGPNVFSRFEERNTGVDKFDSGPHQRWAAGILGEDLDMHSTPVDQQRAIDFAPWPATELEDRQWFGSGQGWSAGNSVLYNVSSTTWRVEDPPTAHNWAIGMKGTNIGPRPNPPHQNGEFQSIGRFVQPFSLYDQQLRERLRDREPSDDESDDG
jgi:hypothetical protein